jgi:3D (Asp-Asp-Asp) domain-containing protein
MREALLVALLAMLPLAPTARAQDGPIARSVAIATVAAGSTAAPARTSSAEGPLWCSQARITGYVRGAHSPRTADGTSIWTGEEIAAASYDVPMGSYVEVDGLGVYRVADRGRLGNTHIDIAVWSQADAYAITGWRQVCIWGPS